MRKRHSPEQIAAVLRQAEAGTPVAEIIRKLGVHDREIAPQVDESHAVRLSV